jgi:hypothetical protein
MTNLQSEHECVSLNSFRENVYLQTISATFVSLLSRMILNTFNVIIWEIANLTLRTNYHFNKD